MSSSVAVTAIGIDPSDLKSLRVLRYATGSALAMALAMGIDRELSFLAPVLALSFLGTPTPRPTLREGFAFVATIAFACVVGVLLARYLLPYPLVYLPFAGLLLFRLFYAKESGAPALLITWMIIALLLIPLLAMTSPALANFVAIALVFWSAVTLLIVWLTYGIFPDPPGTHEGTSATDAARQAPAAPAERFRSAVLSTAVVFPLMVLFYLMQWTASLLVLIFVALLSMQPAFAKNFKVGGAMVIGNVIGGAGSILVYNLLVIVPLFSYLVLLTLLMGLLFGSRVFSEQKSAPIWGMAFSTLVLIVGSVTASTGDAGSKVYTRVAQIMMAVVYVVTAFGVLDRFFRRRET